MAAAVCNIHRAPASGRCAKCKTPTCLRCGEVGKTCSFCREGVIQALEVLQEESDDCVNHDRIRSVSACPSCRRRFCATCLNTQGTCFSCAQRAIDRAVQKESRTKSLEGKLKRQRQKRRQMTRRVGIVAGVMFLLVVASIIYRGHLPFMGPREEVRMGGLAPRKVYDADRRVQQGSRIWKAPTGKTQGAAGAGLPPAPGVVAVGRPAEGARVSGRTVIDARIAQGVPQKVELYVNGTWLGVSDHAPYQFVWDTRSIGSGPARIEIVAYGFDGSLRRSSPVSVQVVP